MALVECVECGGTVSDAAVYCPHCGHPEPGGVMGARIATPDTQAPGAMYREVQVSQVTGPIWPILIWAVGGFVVGVSVNVLIETAGIALSGDFSWGLVYALEWNWIRVLLPYTVAAIGTLIGLSRRKKGDTNNYRTIGYILGAVALVGLGVVLYAAYRAGFTEDASIASNEPAVTTTGEGDLYIEFQVFDTVSSRSDPDFGSRESGIPCIDDSDLGTDIRDGSPIRIVDETTSEVVSAGVLSEGTMLYDPTGPRKGEPGHEIFYYCRFPVRLDVAGIQAGHTYWLEFESDRHQQPIKLQRDNWIGLFSWRYSSAEGEAERKRLKEAKLDDWRASRAGG